MESREDLAPNSAPEEDAVSMLDVLREEEELEQDANAVLGGSDAHNCTYSLGYIPRQALYACLSCSPNDPAGICLACSYECHEGCELVELYTKRNFCCDCGNSKFPELTCKLYKNKEQTNSRNRYNQNFKGLYCTCKRPYPDPEDEIEDEMIQCVICEDWYHGRHLGVDELPSDDSYDEMICVECMKKYNFLWAYHVDCQDVVKVEVSDEKENVDIDDAPKAKRLKTEKTMKEASVKDENCGEAGTSSEYCQLKELQNREITTKQSAAFWKEGWRTNLCLCSRCKVMYNERDLEFLTDNTDTVHSYETQGKEQTTPSSQYAKGMQALSGMDRLQQVEMLQGYHDMKSALSDYLKSFAESGKVVTAEDIKGFFSQMETKRKKSSAPMQYFCK
ncbi:hypothetical protein FSP39_014316 [Pinctada imbricata]|uniref:Putative E3 ubiquitin-protein ligase UBR7 n=1 Tax=Pinctada imbricata TaxID=66713 RepID=A0AA88XVQ0_PINIB|nr:hypothetical protein FSP39_014316 [Pinctada imbricata]